MNTGEYALRSDSALECPCSLDVSPVDAFQEHRQLCRREGNGAALRLRPHEAALLEALSEETKTIAIEPKTLHDVTMPAAEDKDMAGEGLQLEHRLHLSAQSMKSSPHVGDAGRDPDPGAVR